MSAKKHKNQPKKNSRKKRKAAALKQQRIQDRKNQATKVNASNAPDTTSDTSPEHAEDSAVLNSKAALEPASGLTPESSPELASEPTSESSPELASEPTPELALESVSKPAPELSGSASASKSALSGKLPQFPFGTTVFFVGLVLYLELLFHGYHFGISNVNTLRIILFSVLLGGFISVIVNLFPKVINHILTITVTCLLSIIFIVQFLHYSVFQHYLAFFGMLQYTNQAADNFDTVWLNIKAHPIMMVLFILPIIIVVILSHRILNLQPRKWRQSLLLLGSIILLYAGSILGLKLTDSDTYSAYEIYRYYTSVDMAIEQLGVCETLVVDTRQGIAAKLGFENEIQFHMTTSGDTSNTNTFSDNPDAENTEKTDAENPEEVTRESTEEIIDTSPNIMDIDFEAIAEESDNDSVASLCEYFETLTPTNKNEYTGMFEGYNVIQITAEGFSGYALESGLFPTLSMMAEDGFVFENYYSPLWYGSTLGGEYANLMGSMPKNGGYLSLSHGASNGNTFLFSLGNQLQSIGYETYAFHNNSYTYYDRNLTHPALGYTWIANGSGLDEQVNEYGTTLWPQSDLVMIQDTFEQYSTSQPFHLYYLTVSGHVVYSFDGNAMSQKNQDIVADLDYSETTKAYLAAQYELEQAMKELIQELKEHDLYDNTVIILAGDHVPYDNMEILDELAGYELEDSFEAYESTLIIWSGAMEEPVKVDKVCSSIDILPTVSNLLGLEYDSRLIIGQDILSDNEGLVMFANRSFITDRYSYDTSSGTLNIFDGSEISDDELSEMRAYVANKYTAADAITDYDFYKYILPYKKYAAAFEPD